jgi:hypothetical protein
LDAPSMCQGASAVLVSVEVARRLLVSYHTSSAMQFVVGMPGAHGIIQREVANASISFVQGRHMQRAGPSPLALTHIPSILAPLAALLTGCPMSWFALGFACFDTCSTPDYYFAQLAPREALFMLPCVVLAALAEAVFALHCLDTRQTGRALFVSLFFLVGGLLGAVALYGLAQLALVALSQADSPDVNQQAANWFRLWTFALILVAVVWSGSLALLQWTAEWSSESEQRWKRLSQRWRRLDQRSST